MITRKFIGRDCELSTTGSDATGRALQPWDVTRRVLRKVDAAFAPYGTRAWRKTRDGYRSAESIDCMRNWCPNGQCAYSDMAHVEVCTAEVLSPRAFAVQSLSVLVLAERARRAAELSEETGTTLQLTAANVDALDPGTSWGTHLSVSIAPALFDDLFREQRHPSLLGSVASSIAAAIPFFGGGYLLPLADGTTLYSPSARAHHLTRIISHTTTEAFARGLLNSRREGHARDVERLHLIGFDMALAGAAPLASFVQCSLAAAELGRTRCELYDPVHALASWSTSLDPATGRIDARARRVDGRRRTLADQIAETSSWLLDLVERGRIPEEVAPEAREHLGTVVELAESLGRGDLVALAPRLDWAAKWLFLRELERGEGLDLAGPEARILDHDFASTDPEHGVFWRLLEEGLVEPGATLAEAEAALADGPAESRARLRGRLIAALGDSLVEVDWDELQVALGTGRLGLRLAIELDVLDGLGEEQLAAVLARADDPRALRAALERARPRSTRIVDPCARLSAEVAVPAWVPSYSGPSGRSTYYPNREDVR